MKIPAEFSVTFAIKYRFDIEAASLSDASSIASGISTGNLPGNADVEVYTGEPTIELLLKKYEIHWHYYRDFKATFPNWVVGYDQRPIYRAAIMAQNLYDARDIIAKAHGPNVLSGNMRFFNERHMDDSWQPFTDFCPRQDWMEWD